VRTEGTTGGDSRDGDTRAGRARTGADAGRARTGADSPRGAAPPTAKALSWPFPREGHLNVRSWPLAWNTEYLTREEQEVLALAATKGFRFEKWAEGTPITTFTYSLVDQLSNSVNIEHQDLAVIRRFLEDYPDV
jgi:hypothetical protein